jgi:hypothetical protein
MQVAALTVGEPDPGLFQIPTDYVERSPSEVFQEARGCGAESVPIAPAGTGFGSGLRRPAALTV